MELVQQIALSKSAVLCTFHGLWMFSFTFLIVAYILSVKADVVQPDEFFISAAVNEGDLWPESHHKLQGAAHRIGGVGLCLTAQSLLFVVFGVHYLRSMEFLAMADEQSKPIYLQNMSNCFGLITSFALTAVSHFDFRYDEFYHMLFGVPFFVGATLFMLTQSIIDWRVYGIGYKLNHKIFIIRQVLCLSSIISVFIFMITFVMGDWGISSAFEVILVCCFLFYWMTWHGRFSAQMYLSIEKPREPVEVETVSL